MLLPYPETPPIHPKNPQGSPRLFQGSPRFLPASPKDAPRTPKASPRCPKTPSRSQKASPSPQNTLKCVQITYFGILGLVDTEICANNAPKAVKKKDNLRKLHMLAFRYASLLQKTTFPKNAKMRVERTQGVFKNTSTSEHQDV